MRPFIQMRFSSGALAVAFGAGFISHYSWAVPSPPVSSWSPNWDRLEPFYLLVKDQASPSDDFVVRNLLLVRHGQYVMAENADDRVLTVLGKEQAKRTAERVKELLGDIQPDEIHVSTLIRAVQTADCFSEVFPGVKRTSHEALCEGRPCVPVPTPGHWDKLVPEELAQDSERIERAFRTIVRRTVQLVPKKAAPNAKEWQRPKEKFEVVVCHANVIRYIAMRAVQLDPQAWLRFSIFHCGITWIRIHANGKVTIRSLGDAGHLPALMLTIR